ncbi:MAG: hypothetical protein KatS3mg113_1036 [Planctomycetaceae bacterium]|nr:MAG: hypothetical protein KatS3mg113_1036 [Planctomycetaceae bacterium]
MPLLDREEYIEQAYFFRTLAERLEENIPAQEILQTLREEILATTRLPLAIDILRGELIHEGRLSRGMQHLPHYFTPFQIFVIQKSEEDKSRFDQKTALAVLEREARYRSDEPTPAGLFVYQFECLARNRLGYDRGLEAVAQDPLYDDAWRDWIRKVRLRLGIDDFADLIYYRSEWYVEERRRTRPEWQPSVPILFGRAEGRIAKANRKKDPLYLFAALQRQLNYPAVPRAKQAAAQKLPPQLELRFQRLEKRLQLLESEMHGKLDLSEFYVQPEKFSDAPGESSSPA